MKINDRTVLLVAAVLMTILLLGPMLSPGGSRSSEMPFSDFLVEVDAGRIDAVTIRGQEILGTYQGGQPFRTFVPAGTDIVDRLTTNGVRITATPEPQPSFMASLFISVFPILLLVGAWIFVMRRMQGGGPGGVMGFAKSKAKILNQGTKRITFADVAGIDEAKQELEEIVDFLGDPDKFTRLGGRIPKGVLLVGPPGTGKTLLARAIAGEANVPFFTISGSDFVEMFVGVGASRVRDMFEQGKRNAPCIVFIDEIDAVGRSRGAGLGGGHDEREQTLNQLLVEMDGFEATEGVILVAATNRPDVLDPALLRPGRFDRQVVVPNPDVLGREQILQVHMRDVPLANDVEPRVIARGTPGFSGADLANLVNEAALLAARAGRRIVAMADFEAAKDKVMMGAERRSMVMTEDEKRLTAYHEAGHALVGLFVPGNVTTGAGNDIQQATGLARRMVTEWGMSDTLGRLRYSENKEQVFLGRSISQTQNVSDDTARLIDNEVRRIIEEAETLARQVLSENPEALGALAEALLIHETLSGAEVRAVLDGQPVERQDPGDTDRSPRAGSVPPVKRPRRERPKSVLQPPQVQPEG